MTEKHSDIELVSILVVVYRDCWNARATNEDEFDTARAEGAFGFLTKALAENFTELDWHIVRVMVEHHPWDSLAPFVREVNNVSQIRGEAFLHFYVRTRRNPQALLAFHFGSRAWRRRIPPEADWHGPYMGERWNEVEDLIYAIEHSGLCETAEGIEAVATDAETSLAR